MTKINIIAKLTGSEKQIAWATRIQKQWFDAINDIFEDAEKDGAIIAPEMVERIEKEINSKTTSEFWILKDNDGSLPTIDAIKIIKGQAWTK